MSYCYSEFLWSSPSILLYYIYLYYLYMILLVFSFHIFFCGFVYMHVFIIKAYMKYLPVYHAELWKFASYCACHSETTGSPMSCRAKSRCRRTKSQGLSISNRVVARTSKLKWNSDELKDFKWTQIKLSSRHSGNNAILNRSSRKQSGFFARFLPR